MLAHMRCLDTSFAHKVDKSGNDLVLQPGQAEGACTSQQPYLCIRAEAVERAYVRIDWNQPEKPKQHLPMQAVCAVGVL